MGLDEDAAESSARTRFSSSFRLTPSPHAAAPHRRGREEDQTGEDPLFLRIRRLVNVYNANSRYDYAHAMEVV